MCTPVLPEGLTPAQRVDYQRTLLDSLLVENNIADFIAWYYTPMAREFSRHVKPSVTVYDCMDELSAFAGAPAGIRAYERELFEEADLVFTGGASLFEAKRKQHKSVHLFPSSVDIAHFAKARSIEREPADQAPVPRPRLGYAGVIDERMDLELLRDIADQRPEWQVVLLGPVAKINPASLPQRGNIHYLGMKQYTDLPAYFSGWQIGMLPFALNESTRFISPTKTPEYLAAGLSVVSTPIRDVVSPYGDLKLVGIAENARDFLRIADGLLKSPPNEEFRDRVDAFVSQSSWDKTWSAMNRLIERALAFKRLLATKPVQRIGAADMTLKGAAHV
ncbi:MAG: glycosyltransferase family 1 protein [Acidobacteriaceae bacterium]|nr:glycosyltransferase family 1 protein [Acidobacteriaceae bacterium]